MLRNKKIQVSVEFVLVFSLLAVFVTLFLGMIFVNMSQARSQNEVELVSDLANSIQQEVVLAANVEDGYQRNFTLPSTLGGKDYSVEFLNYHIVVNASKTTVVRGIPRVNDPLSIHLLKLPGHVNTIYKNESGIYITSV
jgi:uncharacterized protein (UPF0333 family)